MEPEGFGVAKSELKRMLQKMMLFIDCKIDCVVMLLAKLFVL